MQKKYKYVFDLSEEWHKMTSLPFVFATWIANKPINQGFIRDFNKALQFGLDNLDNVITEYNINFPNSPIDLKDYLTQNIDFYLDNKKKESIKLFYDLLIELELLPVNAIENINI